MRNFKETDLHIIMTLLPEIDYEILEPSEDFYDLLNDQYKNYNPKHPKIKKELENYIEELFEHHFLYYFKEDFPEYIERETNHIRQNIPYQQLKEIKNYFKTHIIPIYTHPKDPSFIGIFDQIALDFISIYFYREDTQEIDEQIISEYNKEYVKFFLNLSKKYFKNTITAYEEKVQYIFEYMENNEFMFTLYLVDNSEKPYISSQEEDLVKIILYRNRPAKIITY